MKSYSALLACRLCYLPALYWFYRTHYLSSKSFLTCLLIISAGLSIFYYPFYCQYVIIRVNNIRLETDYTISEMNYTRSEMNYTCSEMNYTCSEMNYTCSEMDHTITKMKYTRSEMDYTLSETNYACLETDYTLFYM